MKGDAAPFPGKDWQDEYSWSEAAEDKAKEIVFKICRNHYDW